MRVGDKAIYFGDLNDVLYENEYCRGSNIFASQLSWGRQTLELCGLIDLGLRDTIHLAKWKERERECSELS